MPDTGHSTGVMTRSGVWPPYRPSLPTRPSEDWIDWQAWEHVVQSQNGFALIDRQEIRTIAMELRNVTCELSEKCVLGETHAIFEIAFADGVYWICRARKVDCNEHPRFIKLATESTIATMRLVKQYTF